MPEGDSVYRQCKMLREALKGQVLASSDLRVPALATTDLSGRTVVDVVPRGKHILIRLSAAPNASELKSGAEPLTLHSHLMMDGTWRVFERAVAAQDGAERESGARAACQPGQPRRFGDGAVGSPIAAPRACVPVRRLAHR